MVTLTGLRPPGGIEVAGGTVRIRFIEDAGTVTTEAADPPAPPGNKPLVTVAAEPMALRMWPSAEAVHACSFWIPATPDRRRPVDRRRHSSIAHRLPCATPGRGRLSARRGRPWRGCIPIIDIREDHSMKLLTEEQRTKLLANGTRRGADHKPVVKWFNPCGRAPGWCRSSIPNTRMSVHSAWLIWASAHPNWGQSVCSN